MGGWTGWDLSHSRETMQVENGSSGTACCSPGAHPVGCSLSRTCRYSGLPESVRDLMNCYSYWILDRSVESSGLPNTWYGLDTSMDLQLVNRDSRFSLPCGMRSPPRKIPGLFSCKSANLLSLLIPTIRSRLKPDAAEKGQAGCRDKLGL